jgi:hypothetical protein
MGAEASIEAKTDSFRDAINEIDFNKNYDAVEMQELTSEVKQDFIAKNLSPDEVSSSSVSDVQSKVKDIIDDKNNIKIDVSDSEITTRCQKLGKYIAETYYKDTSPELAEAFGKTVEIQVRVKGDVVKTLENIRDLADSVIPGPDMTPEKIKEFTDKAGKTVGVDPEYVPTSKELADFKDYMEKKFNGLKDANGNPTDWWGRACDLLKAGLVGFLAWFLTGVLNEIDKEYREMNSGCFVTQTLNSDPSKTSTCKISALSCGDYGTMGTFCNLSANIGNLGCINAAAGAAPTPDETSCLKAFPGTLRNSDNTLACASNTLDDGICSQFCDGRYMTTSDGTYTYYFQCVKSAGILADIFIRSGRIFIIYWGYIRILSKMGDIYRGYIGRITTPFYILQILHNDIRGSSTTSQNIISSFTITSSGIFKFCSTTSCKY